MALPAVHRFVEAREEVSIAAVVIAAEHLEPPLNQEIAPQRAVHHSAVETERLGIDALVLAFKAT